MQLGGDTHKDERADRKKSGDDATKEVQLTAFSLFLLLLSGWGKEMSWRGVMASVWGVGEYYISLGVKVGGFKIKISYSSTALWKKVFFLTKI